MDIRGTEQADSYDQETAGHRSEWITYYGLGGNDLIRLLNGQAIGGAGNDRIEKIASTDWWRTVSVSYWDAPAGAVVDLAAGTAQDGWGTTDTLIGVSGVNGGGHNDRFYGSDGDNNFSSGGGKDLIDGRGGTDSLVLPWVKGAPLTLDTVSISVSIDGRTAVITSALDSNFRVDLIDVERVALDWPQPYMELGSFITPTQLAHEGLVGGPAQRWNAAGALGSSVSVSYSFVSTAPAGGPGSEGFRAFTAAERQSVRDILARTSALSGLSFVEVTESGSASGQMRFGVSAQTQTKGVSWLPDIAAGNATAGDVWMDADSMAVLAPGSEGYAALLHEIGHALGLRHPRNTDPGDAWSAQFRAVDDVSSLTVMASTASPDGLFRADWGALDVEALRYLYGSRATALGDTVHSVGGLDAQAQRALLDSGGTDAIDASASPVGTEIDLVPGHRSSVGVSADGYTAVDNLGLGVDTWIENATGSAWDDVLTGNRLDNSLTGGLGNDWIDGAAGRDTAVFSGQRTDYRLSTGFGYTYAAAADGTSGFDTLVNVETLRFADRSVDLAAATRAAGIAATSLKTLEELYVGFFNRIPEASGLGYWIDQIKAGVSLASIANQFYDAGVVFGNYPSNMTNAQFVREIYKNVLGRPPGVPPTDAEVGYWEDRLVRKIDTKGTMVLQMLSDVHTYFEGITDPTNPNYAFQFVSAHLNNKAAVANWYAVQQGLSLNVQADNVAFGIQMAALITPTDTTAAIGLVGLSDSFSNLV